MELRAAQFKEDASPLAHAIRPDTYESIDNFYTPTVYRKGARVIDMFHTLLQPQGFRSAMDLYFDRYTGKAVTCDDFVQCMEDSSGYDMTQFKLWYSQAGTPTVDASWEHDPQTDKFSLTMTQKVPPTPGQDKKSPMVIPVKFGMVGSQGGDVALNAEGDTEAVLVLDQESQSFEFENIPQGSVPSILRNFSAPVILNAPYTDDQRRHLMIHDSDGFNQWEAGRQIVLKEMLAQVDCVEAGEDIIVNPVVIESLRDMIKRPDMDKQLLALMLNTPGYGDMAQKRTVINPEALDKVERTFNTAIRTSLQSELLKLYQDNNTGEPYKYDRESVGRRSLKNIALYYLCADDQVNDPAMTALAEAQYQTADNMTDRSAGIRALLRMNPDSPEAQSALSDFYQIFHNDSAPLDSWFAMSVAGDKDQVIEKAKAMKQHPDFRNASPNRLRALISGVTGACETYHNKDGSGYHFVADEVITQDKLNPHLAAGIVGLFADFRKLAQPWQEGMKEALLRIATQPELSGNVNDKLKKILGNDYPQRMVSVAASPQNPAP
jgi:aminopeptidase N